MTTIDQFESVFLSADKAVFAYTPVTLGNVLLVSDLDEAPARALIDRCRHFLAAIDQPETRWDQLGGSDFSNVKELLDAVEDRNPDLIVTYRHLHSSAWHWPYSLGEYLDVLTQATSVPVLVLPHPEAGHASSHALNNTDQVLAVTGHLTGDDRIVNTALAFTSAGGTCRLTHVENSLDFERYMAAISKIPAIDSETARETLEAQLLKEPSDYIASCRRAIEAAGLTVTIADLVVMGRRLTEYRRLVEAHEVDLLVMHTKDEDQMAMHGMAYPLAIELRQIPLLML
jgi:nucleotide-binding universal stress UspA family protein